VASPKADSASRIAARAAAGKSAGSSTQRIPRPPPPAMALTKTGNGSASAAATSTVTSSVGWLEASTGNLASRAAAIARALWPVNSRTCADAPTKVIPAAAQAAARSGFSERNP
jgi:hypothetical protein